MVFSLLSEKIELHIFIQVAQQRFLCEYDIFGMFILKEYDVCDYPKFRIQIVH